MTPAMLPLEPRLSPAILAAAGDTAYTPAGPLTPYPGVDVEACRVPDQSGDGTPEIATVPAAGGGPVVRVYDGATLEMRASFFAFDPDLRWGYRIAADRGTIAVGIGDGGGPLVAEFDARTFAERARYWAGDPESRRGVSLSADDFDFAPIVVSGGVPYDLSRLGVRLIGPGEPTADDWQGVRDSLAYVPPNLVRDYLAAGGGIDVTLGPITADPSVSALSGVAVEGWGVPGTYDQISGVSDVNGALVRIDGGGLGGSVDTLLHELAHGVDRLVLAGASGRADWLAVWTGGPWPTEYERTDPEEAWAESLARDLLSLPQPFAAVSQYFAALKSARVW